MPPRTGRPKVENPKDIQLKIRADQQTMKDLDFCCEKLGKTRSDIIRLGIQRVKTELEKK
jgi:antitoxin component of RelBE/YafQ-DinJ toxin-antitoxin module